MSKKRRKLISYEYQIKACTSWEYADVFQDINSWHESVKGNVDEKQPIKLEKQDPGENTKGNIFVDESSMENMHIGWAKKADQLLQV